MDPPYGSTVMYVGIMCVRSSPRSPDWAYQPNMVAKPARGQLNREKQGLFAYFFR